MIRTRYPLLQAPMAGVSTPAMAAAVSEAGGLGAIGIGASSVADARRMIEDVKTRTKGPFQVNVFCHRPATADPAREQRWIDRLQPELAKYDAPRPTHLREIYERFSPAMLQLLVETKPAVVSFHFGIPSAEAITALHESFLIGTATSLDEALALEAAGVGAVVAQGYEAGGHRGVFDPDAPDERLPTLVLVRKLVTALRAPVIAAGGLMDAADIAAALAAGAMAAQLGTAFVGCPESLADEGYRALLFSPAAQHTQMTRAISGRPARCLANWFTALDVREQDIPAYPIAYDLAKTLHAAAKAKGDFSHGASWAGTGAPRAKALPAGELVRELMGVT